MEVDQRDGRRRRDDFFLLFPLEFPSQGDRSPKLAAVVVLMKNCRHRRRPSSQSRHCSLSEAASAGGYVVPEGRRKNWILDEDAILKLQTNGRSGVCRRGGSRRGRGQFFPVQSSLFFSLLGGCENGWFGSLMGSE